MVRTETLNADGSLALQNSHVFDNRNRLIESRQPHLDDIDSIVRYELDPESNLIGMIDPRGNRSSSVYDPSNRLIESTHRLNGVTEYEYDLLDQLVSVTAPNGVVTRFENDLIGRRITEISPDRGTISYQYDLANNMTEKVDGRGVVTQYSYDQLERLETKTFPANSVENVSYSYDNCAFGLGYVCQIDDETGQTRYQYDSFGNLVQQEKDELGQTYLTQYQYDDGDNLIQMTYPSGRVINYGRDGIRRIDSISTSLNGTSQVIVDNIQYRGDHQMTQCRFGNNLEDNRSYDLQGRVLNQVLATGTSTLDSRFYNYDQNSNILSRTTTPQTSNYQYDPLDRLIEDQIDNQQANQYNDYDLNHNRLQEGQADVNQRQYFYQNQSNRLWIRETLNPDSLSNQLPILRRTETYNNANRRTLVLDENSNMIASFLYNAQGQRTRKTTPEGVTVFHYNLAGQLISETTDTGELIKDYLWHGMNPVAQIVHHRDAANDELYYLHTDHLHTPRFATNQSGQIVWQWEGQAFGETVDLATETISFNLRFPGQYIDRETGTYYNYFRDYDPGVGRYLQSDPIGLAGGLNTYAYVGANPVNYIDPYGESATAAVGGWVGTDAAIPDPTDAAWPKWVGYGAALGGAALIDWLIYNNENSNDDGGQCPVDKDNPPNHPDFVPDKKEKK